MKRGGGRVSCGGPSRRWLVSATAACVLVAQAAVVQTAAAQQNNSANERIAAEALFREALQLMGEGNYSDACPKLAESQRLDPGLGTLVNLALCHEAEGKTASAWLEFTEAVSLAHQNKRPDRERVARMHIKALEPKLAKLSVRVSAEARAVPGLEVRRDGLTLKEGVWGSPIPVDPGKHEVSAGATGYETWTTTVEIPPEPGQHDVTVPELAKKEEPPPPASPPPAPPPPPIAPGSTKPFELSQRTVGFIVGGAGAAALLVGGYFGVRALDKAGKVDDRCPEKQCSDAGAVDLNDEAGRAATIANVAVGVGVVGLGAGALLVLTARPDGKPASSGGAAPRSALLPSRWLAPELGRDRVFLRFGGSW